MKDQTDLAEGNRGKNCMLRLFWGKKVLEAAERLLEIETLGN
jgi:hypothetical protein